MKIKEDVLWISVMILFGLVLVQVFIIGFGVNLINDLKDTANSYKNSENICEMKLDNLTQELERWQSE